MIFCANEAIIALNQVKTMENLLTNKIASLTELRDPKKVIDKAGDKPVAIVNRNKLEGYFVPASAVNKIDFKPADHDEVMKVAKEVIHKNKKVLDYLKDK